MVASEAVFLFIDGVTETSISISKSDIYCMYWLVKKVKKEIIGDFPSVVVRLVDPKMAQYSSKIPKERLQALINNNKYKFHVTIRVQESDLDNRDCLGSIFISGMFKSS